MRKTLWHLNFGFRQRWTNRGRTYLICETMKNPHKTDKTTALRTVNIVQKRTVSSEKRETECSLLLSRDTALSVDKLHRREGEHTGSPEVSLDKEGLGVQGYLRRVPPSLQLSNKHIGMRK